NSCFSASSSINPAENRESNINTKDNTDLSLVVNSKATVFFQYQAEYNLSWNGIIVGKSTHELRTLGNNRYIVSSQSLPKLKLLPFSDFEKSEFLVQDQEIIPLIQEFYKQEKGKKEVGVLIFDWKAGKVIKKMQGTKPSEESLPPNTQDKITYIFKLRQDLVSGKKD